MDTVRWIISTAPEIFLLLAIAIGTLLGRIRIRGFSIGTTACVLIVAVLIGQLGSFTFPPILRAILFSLFVFTIGYRSGPEFFASLSVRTLAQVILALVIGATGLIIVLVFAYAFKLDTGTAAGLTAGALTQSSVIGTASGALAQLGLPKAALEQQEANIAAGYAVTYVLGYILTLLFVPFVAPRLMRIDLKAEAAKLEAELAGGAPAKTENLSYRKFQARAYRVSAGADRTIEAIEAEIGGRSVVERIVRRGADVPPHRDVILEAGDDVVVTGPTAAIVAAEPVIGMEIDAGELLRNLPGNVTEVLVENRRLHGRSIREIADIVGANARGVFLRALTRMGREVPLGPDTRVYIGDVMTLVGSTSNIARATTQVGHSLNASDRTDIAFLAIGIAAGLLAGLASFKVGAVALTLGGGGGALIAGLVCGWLRSRNPTMGALPPAAQQTLSDLGLGGFIAAIGLGNGLAAWAAIQAHGFLLVGMGVVVTLIPLTVGTLFAYHVLRMNPVVTCGALAGAMTVDAAVTGACDVAESKTPVLGVAVPYAVGNVLLTVLGPIVVAATYTG
ncbi:aspartate:alanine exchanger family transporter [Bradyrhizobium japonicum]|uniref:aspartate:alanine exchanger family transporter n=1 Tax=Bradyrhizobium japonicum TaxID=375 RepID=UPI000456935E|nr:TrkA C-terminal domain-containing protein [Bradyrhizobium japonicum]AHY53396.1 aspartate:alanine antiporter [Bradyrhizobium japonicum SEMIA 5079]MCD9106109.1 transporter [Bradyrhizobium japonicum]MCD9252548.1 transporter [Bradyrhizobium japonicum SEMIA 5079]MCD9817238.1 transporter [Bradyrhizobium japonicum]MCD9890339.1 transporter [Bradyrhizobium japonicum]